MNQKNILRYLNTIPLWTQLITLMTFILSLTIVVILGNNYSRNRAAILETQVNTTNKLLHLEAENFDQYIKDLIYFSIQPCYDSKLSRIFDTKFPLDTSQKSYVKNQMRAYYYARNDLISYHIYLTGQSIEFIQNLGTQKTVLGSKPEQTKGTAILPASSDKAFLDFYHTIIRIKDKEPIAIVKVTVDQSYIKSLVKNHNDNGEFLCILNENNDLLYSGNQSLIHRNHTQALKKVINNTANDYVTLKIKDQSFIVTMSESNSYHIKLVSFTPSTVVDTAILHAFQISLLMGVLVWIIAILLTTALIRFTTIPLSTLANNLRNVGNGDFTTTVDIGGNREITNLSYDFNYMIQHIDALIKKNYVSELNEKTARLIALEAQLNPHFLYNTLQVISTEALINDQPKINKMITSLASILRYTIKGGDLVSLSSELEYVNHYILLQKMRLEEKLTVSVETDSSALTYLVPKISIQTLVENSILHGMGKSDHPIHIHVSSRICESLLVIQVDDDGCGISPEYLDELTLACATNQATDQKLGIGLVNLNSRLKLLYEGKASFQIDSKEGAYTSIILTIPIIKENTYV
ncbi:MAG: two-component system, sensor histidine kinase YesM [Clostridiales bacterium]|nr:two-component system, sensor histidine kinase YesM [Clostridiales bacterium]